MGQPITVVEKPSSNPALLRLETNRPLSGMGHERYAEAPSDLLERPVDELARRLFATGDVEAVHINGSVVTVTLLGGRTGEGLGDIVRQLFRHYGDEAPAGDAPAAADDAPAVEESAPAEAPVTEAPATDAPAEQPPAEQPAAAEEPAAEQPADEAPAGESDAADG